MKRARQNPWRRWLWLLCYLAAFHPNCARCCPEGYGCSCKWAWEDCPQNGCGCSNSSGAVDAGFGFEASTKAEPIQPVLDDPPGGTIAFVPSASGAFVVVAIPSKDAVHVVHLEATKLDEDPLTLRTIGDVSLGRDVEPGRTIADEMRARIALRRGGMIATLDPATLAVDRRRVCAAPHGLALGKDLLHVGCGSGELVTLSASTDQEVKHQFLDGDLEDVALFGDSIVASTRASVVVVEPNGSITMRDANESRRNATAYVSLTALGSMPIADLDVGPDGALVLVSNGDAWLQPSGTSELVPVGAPGIARAAALGTVTTGEARRRLVAVQTDALLVFYALSKTPDVLAIEPLAP